MGLFGKTSKKKYPDVRYEGIAKVTGRAKYTAEFEVPNVCYGVLVGSTIAAGSIRSIDTSLAKQVDGVVDILSYYNKPAIAGFASEAKIKETRFGLPLFYTDKVYFKGQPIAMVIADSLEDATYAAALITAEYQEDKANVDFAATLPSVSMNDTGKEKGSVQSWQSAPFIVENEFTIGNEVHNPMEMHATIAQWKGNKLKLYDKNQGVNMVQKTLAPIFEIPEDDIEVISEYVGGGFGSGLVTWPHTVVTAIAAKLVNRPVKVVLTRPQMFYLVGYRPQSWQNLKLGADESGNFVGLLHQARHSSSVYQQFWDGITGMSRLVYSFPNIKTEQAAIPLNMGRPIWMRGPGDVTGAFALESAIDELSYKLKKDPLELRLQNISDINHPDSDKPWSTHFLKDCINRGAEMIGWKENRKSEPGLLTDGDWKIGYGMSVGMWNSRANKSGAAIHMKKDGSILVQTAMTDIGTGTYTAVQNIAFEYLGIDKNKVDVALGHTTFPSASTQGGSTGLASISGAVVTVCDVLKQKLASLAALKNPVYKTITIKDILLSDKGISYQTPDKEKVSYEAIWEANNGDDVVVEGTSTPGEEAKKYAFACASAHFCKVRVHSKTGKVKIDDYVNVVDGGKIVNMMAATNQIIGASVGAIGMALLEEQHTDPRYNALVGNDFAGYHFATNADAPIIRAEFIGKPDYNLDPTGSKGIGEVGIIGGAPAIANAIYNAIGKRLRDLPITPDKILLA